MNYSYFGMRYYDSDASIFISVDPLAKERPSLSPYNYCSLNPISRVDPTGALDDEWDILKTKDGSVDIKWKSTRGGNKIQHINFVNENNEAKGSISLKTSKENIRNLNFEKKETGEDKRGHIVSVANGIAAAGPIGIMGDIGSVTDSYGNSKMYFTIGWAQGYGAGAGMGYNSTNKAFRTEDMNGWSSGWMGSFFIFSLEHFGDMQHGAVKDYYGDKMTSNGGSIGTLGFGGYHYFSYTITFDPPPSEFWIRPGRK